MNRSIAAILCLAYLLGLLSTAWLDFPADNLSWQQTGILVLKVSALGLVAAVIIPRFWRTGPQFKWWLIASLIAALAVLHFQVRIPQPGKNDVSWLVPVVEETHRPQAQIFKVEGKVKSMPRLTRNQRAQFWLEAKQLNDRQAVTGKLYVTVPLLQATGVYPGQKVALTGRLYKPQSASNPGAFDFREYLAYEGASAGLSGQQLTFIDNGQEPLLAWWKIRQRIIRAQVRWLYSPAGQLVSSMVLGRKAVDLPHEIRDRFIQAGLAHILAASGFHVSLLLGVMLALTKHLSKRLQFSIGLSTLIVYVGLTGIQPSVMRAAVMGVGALLALATERTLKPLGSLLLAATLLLLFNPLWIWDLGFQLSFLATLGLLVTLRWIVKQLDWLPPPIATIVAIPLAIFPWVLPLQLYVFGLVAPYSVLVNIITVPLTVVISLGGMISALAALILPVLGSAIAGLLYYPAHLLIGIVNFFTQLPGNSVALGTISWVQLVILYGLIGLVWLSQWWQQRWGFVSVVALSLVVFPFWQTQLNLVQITVLASNQEQILVSQDHRKVTLINSGEADTAMFTVVPFLKQQGINQINLAVAFDSQPYLQSGWSVISESLSVKDFLINHSGTLSTESRQEAIANLVQTKKANYQTLAVDQTVLIGQSKIRLISSEPPILQLQVRDQTWLLLNEKLAKNYPQNQQLDSNPQVLLWSGKTLSQEWLRVVQPKVAIASSSSIDTDTIEQLRKKGIQLYWTGRDGAIQWTPEEGFETTIETLDLEQV